MRCILSRVPTVLCPGSGLYVEAEPKTKKSRRSIVLTVFALDALRKHKERSSGNRIRFCTFTDVHGSSRCASLAVSRVVLCRFFRGVSLVLLHDCYTGDLLVW